MYSDATTRADSMSHAKGVALQQLVGWSDSTAAKIDVNSTSRRPSSV